MASELEKENVRLRLKKFINELAQSIIAGATKEQLLVQYGAELDKEAMDRLLEAPAVLAEVNRLLLAETQRKHYISKGWNALEEVCLGNLLEAAQDNQDVKENVMIARLALDAKKQGLITDGNGMIIQNNNYINVDAPASNIAVVQPKEAETVKKTSVYPREQVYDLFNVPPEDRQ